MPSTRHANARICGQLSRCHELYSESTCVTGRRESFRPRPRATFQIGVRDWSIPASASVYGLMYLHAGVTYEYSTVTFCSKPPSDFVHTSNLLGQFDRKRTPEACHLKRKQWIPRQGNCRNGLMTLAIPLALPEQVQFQTCRLPVLK